MGRRTKIVVLTLFPEFFDGPLSVSIPQRAVDSGALEVVTVDIRDFATDRHRTVDDNPYGGGPGMLMMATPLAEATEHARALADDGPVLLLSPQGEPLRQPDVRGLAKLTSFVLVCGRYEGIDERYVDELVDAEISVGDFVLSGGEPAALCVIDAVARCLQGVLGNPESAPDDSFEDGLLEFPQFTRPAEFRGRGIPDILLSGHHAKIDAWRHEMSARRTRARRPDLWARWATRHPEALELEPATAEDAWMVAPRPLRAVLADRGASPDAESSTEASRSSSGDATGGTAE